MGEDHNQFLFEDPNPATDVMNCATQCWDIGDECTYFAFKNNGQCWLKKNLVKKVNDNDMTSGMRCEPIVRKGT